MGKKAGNRKHSKIDALDPALRETVEQMLLSGSTYSEIVDFLGDNGVGISVASVCRYARAYQAEVQMLNMAQENFRRMMDELDKYPESAFASVGTVDEVREKARAQGAV